MLINKKKIVNFIISIALIIVFGVIGALLFMNYGGNNCDQPPTSTCSCFCCNMFNSRGYEACSQFGLYAGIILAIVTKSIFSRIKWYEIIKKMKNK